jgi:hypothetical protein
MRDNIAYAVFENCSKAVTNALWQYDYGQVLQISGIELPETFEVHLCNRGNNATITQIGQNYQVSIPDEFLTNPTWIDAYIFLHSGLDDGETVYSISIPVSARPMPTDDEPTPEEQSAITQAIAALNDAVQTVQSAAIIVYIENGILTFAQRGQVVSVENDIITFRLEESNT